MARQQKFERVCAGYYRIGAYHVFREGRARWAVYEQLDEQGRTAGAIDTFPTYAQARDLAIREAGVCDVH